MTVLNLRMRQDVKGYLLAGLWSLFACEILLFMHVKHVDILSGASYAVTQGKPEWIAFQNRLLGPFLVLLISKAGISYQTAWMAFTVLVMFLQGMLVYHLIIIRRPQASRPVMYLIVFLFLFFCLQNYWFYTWDSLDLLLFTLFADMVVRDKGSKYLLPLFLVALLNRESAMFIALYTAISAIQLKSQPSHSRFFADPGRLLMGLSMMMGGIVYTRWIRTALFLARPDGSADAGHQSVGNHFNLGRNLREAFVGNLTSFKIVYSIAFVSVLTYFFINRRAATRGEVKAYLISAIIIVNIFCFGLFNETRSFFVLLPFLFFLWMATEERKASAFPVAP